MHKVRRLRVPVLVLVSVMLLTTACATENDNPSGTPSDGAVKPELVIAIGEDVNRVEPAARATVATGTGDANAPVFEPLALLAADFSVKPLLATSWEFRPPATWRFRLRGGVTFHNGAPFEAAAVVWNVNELWGKGPAASALSVGPTSAVAVDRLTVDITPTKPNLRLPEQLVHPSFGIKAPGTYAGDGTSPEKMPTGTGQFKFIAYRKGDVLQVERFDGYWGAKAKTPRITFRFLPDSNSRTLALQAGEVDAMYDFPREQSSQFADDKDLITVKSPVGAYDALLLNHHGKPPYDILSDLRVRQAVAAAIDRVTVVNTVWKGNAEVMNTVIPAPVLGANASTVKGVPFDRARARRLLDEAGWVAGSDGIRTKDGRRLELTLLVTEPALQVPLPELVQSQLKDVGIGVKLDIPTNPATYSERLKKGDGDIFAEVGNQNDGNPIFLGSLFTALGFPDYAGSFGAGPEYDQVFAKASESTDTEEVRRLAAQAMKIAVDDMVTVVPVAGIARIWGLRRNVQGFTPHPSAINQRWTDVFVNA